MNRTSTITQKPSSKEIGVVVENLTNDAAGYSELPPNIHQHASSSLQTDGGLELGFALVPKEQYGRQTPDRKICCEELWELLPL